MSLSKISQKKYWDQMDVSKNTGKPPKWMVKIIENLIKIDDLGGKNHPYFWKHPNGCYGLILCTHGG